MLNEDEVAALESLIRRMTDKQRNSTIRWPSCMGCMSCMSFSPVTHTNF